MSDAVKIYHNPRCSKSRDTLSLLKANGIDPDVVLYLETPPDADTLRQLLKMLGMASARELMRQKEELYKTLQLKDKLPGMSETEQFALLASDGMLVRRPLFISEEQVLVGFKPEIWAGIK